MTEVQRVKAVVEYDGTAYKGFQIQPHDPTVQSALEAGLRSVTREAIRVYGAGRTDAGVHAKGQVVHFDTVWRHSLAVLQRAWNANLPSDIAVRELEAVPVGFHARFGARSREYRYSIYQGNVRSPLTARFSHHVVAPLDLVAMAEAARSLGGKHDFAAFGSPPSGTNTVRMVYRAVFERSGEMVYFDIAANAFLKRMVRLVMGTLLLVGMERLTPTEFRAILAHGESNHPVAAVRPGGLCLMRVNYADLGADASSFRG